MDRHPPRRARLAECRRGETFPALVATRRPTAAVALDRLEVGDSQLAKLLHQPVAALALGRAAEESRRDRSRMLARRLQRQHERGLELLDPQRRHEARAVARRHLLAFARAHHASKVARLLALER